MSIINLSLDFEKLKHDFLNNEYKYITIDNFLSNDVAEILYSGFKDLDDNELWYQAQFGKPNSYKKGLSIDDSSTYHFSYRYEMFPLLNQTLLEMERGGIKRDTNQQLINVAKNPNLFKNPETELSNLNPLRKIAYFLNSDEMHNLITYITSIRITYRKLLAFASKYSSDDYLSLHTDRPINVEIFPRQVAFVLNMTKNWLVHWGGTLIILDHEEKNIIEAINPKFNSLTIFKVPLKHVVLPVSCHCKSERLAITGWYQRY